ncbi:hypothetical protein CEP52_010829 [Fusarium oligoseptatum]|uniref:C2H2-type domain-containing protein n=1 Tax=Fusarium oligoseptatum TaxID=2604345 RepID=A0A428T672_9HYPO|nr:hypothetical protein CEP52_010829 [Fusarium oligoseptatum]
MRYIDETESGDGPLELVDPSKVTTLPPFIPRSANEIAWSCIRDLRDSLQSYWQHFVKVSQNLDHAIINRLYEDYKDASGLQEAGVFAFRNTMIGPAPNDLKKIFAFCSLSYATSRLLHAKGRFEKTEIMAGVSLWLRALENPGEQEAFKILAHSLWPETRSHIDFFDQGPTIQGLDFRITDFVGQEPHNFPDDTLQGQLAGPGHDQFGALGLSPMPIVSPDITKQHISIPSVASIWTNDPRELHHTKVFDAVVQYCRDNGDFWYNLSDQGAISKDIRSLLTWNQQCAREKKLIYEQYMEHLLLEKDTKDVTSRGIVSVAKRFIDTGYLQSTDEAKTYMIKMASLIFTDSRAHERFITWITGFKYPFLCPTCHREFSRKYNMERHYEDVHNRKARKEGARAGGSKPEMPVADSL